MTHRRSSKHLYVIYAVGIVFGAAIISWEAFQLHRQKASFQWPTTSGTIVECTRVFMSGRDAHYRADVTYNYKVNGTSYVSHRISLFSRDLSSYDDINEAFVANHPAGTAVDVYYKPTNPSNAVLIPGPDETFNKFEIGGMTVVIITAILGLIRQIPRDRQLAGLLSAPDAATRTLHLRASDIQKGMHAFMCYAILAFFLSILAIGLLLGPWLQHPAVLLEAPHPMNRRLLIWGIGSLVAAVFFIMLAIKKGRPAECPLCGSLLNQTKVLDTRCPDCKTRIIFDDQNPPPVIDKAKHD
jgi:hypothetical protein